jgi:phosphatidylserine/phosphatidylglycerophosphate/cardiolipin synthase-like enzyme
MPITVKAYANADDVLLAWEPNPWSNDWVGFQVERRDDSSQQVTVLANRIPAQASQGPVQETGVSSAQSPIRRCIWTDYRAVSTDSVSYRVTGMKSAAGGTFAPDPASASDWTPPLVNSADVGGGLSCYFNRGTLMSQVVTRFVGGNVTGSSLHTFIGSLKTPGQPARRYLAGDALTEILNFLSDADRRGSEIYAAIYEMDDQQLVDALKPFGKRGHVLIGNGTANKPDISTQLNAANLVVKHRDLSNAGRSSPSVHNKFVVESGAGGKNASRVLTGSTNWTTSGLCTQLNNMLIIENPTIAARYLDQWNKLVADGNAMPAALVASNSQPTTNNNIELYFAATNGQAEFKPVLELIAGAKEGALFLMFMPGQSPLLDALLDRSAKNDIYVRGVVSSVQPTAKGDIGSAAGQVIKSGVPTQNFHDNVLLPNGISAEDAPSWQSPEFGIGAIRAAMHAIVHSKTIVIDPFSDNCAVITGSHNFSAAASQKNDENLVIVRGNQKLAQAYAVHVNGVYDHYSWRAFLANGGDPKQIYQPLNGWMPGGSRAQELAFWMSEPIPPQPAQKGGAAAASQPATPAKPKGGKTPKAKPPGKAKPAKPKGGKKPKAKPAGKAKPAKRKKPAAKAKAKRKAPPHK